MKKRILILAPFIVILGFSLQSIAQFTAEEVTEREKWEEFLQSRHQSLGAHAGERRSAQEGPLEKSGGTDERISGELEMGDCRLPLG